MEHPWPFTKRWTKRILTAMGQKNFGVLAAGVAFYSTLAFFPLLVALVSITALIVPEKEILKLVANINHLLPGDIASLISTQLTHLVGQRSTTIFATIIGLMVAVYGISGAFDTIIRALNVTYGVKETRSYFQAKRRSLQLTFGAILFMLIVVPMMGVTGTALVDAGLPASVAALIVVLRWPILALLVMAALTVLYRVAPNRRSDLKWHWLTPGALTATVLWMLVTIVFFLYVRYVGHFSNSYSFFAGVIVLMLWFNLSAMTFLIGAEINSHIERSKEHHGAYRDKLKKLLGRHV